MGGYAGQILYVDLTSGRVEKKPLDMTFARSYIGGLGFGVRIYLDLIKDIPNVDPLSPENPFILMTGPLAGLKMDGVARWAVGTRSPQTGFWGDANVGGFFGAFLKFSGYDGMVITGKASKPSFIYIDDDIVEIRDAAKYWGMDTYETDDRLTADLKGESKRSGKVLSIGPAGENMIHFASIINNKRHAAGRTGMGAVWGSKNLKAVYVSGSGKLDVSQPEKLKELKSDLKEVYEDSIYIQALKSAGTPSHIDVGVIGGDVPMKNWLLTDWEGIDDIGPGSIEEKLYAGDKTCYGCSVACKKDAVVKDGPYKMEKGPSPEYETVISFGSLCLNNSIESIAKANDICNRYGMDTITCGATIAFAIECFENGLITEADTDGLKLTWGNSEAIVAMTEKIARKEGFGAILAEGSAKAAKKIGKNAEDFLTTVKGLEAPMHDARSAHGYGLAYGTSPRGACHEASLNFNIEGGAMFIPEIEALSVELEELSSDNRAELNVACQDYGMFFSNCAVYCNLGATPLNATQAVDMVNYVTGFDYTIDEVVDIGRRIWYLKRGISNLFGARAEDDRLPKRLMTPMADGPTEGSVPDMDKMLAEFYELRGFDSNGVPGREVLEKIGLADLADLLHKES